MRPPRVEPGPGQESVWDCEWKGQASYWTVDAGGAVAEAAVWSYRRRLDHLEGRRPVQGCSRDARLVMERP